MPETILDVLERIAEKLENRAAVSRAPAATPCVTSPCATSHCSSNFVNVYGSRMHYLEAGPRSADPVLFVHGNPASSYVWRNIIPSLSSRARCIAVDLIGMGDSGKPRSEYRFLDHYKYLEGFIAQLGLHKITLVLHDWGTGLGFKYLEMHGHNVKAVAFMEAVLKSYPSWDEFPRRGAPPVIAAAFRSCRGESGRRLLIDSDTNFIDLLVKPFTGVDLSPAELEHYSAPFPDRGSREPVWRWPNEIPVACDPPDTAVLVGGFLRSLTESCVPKLLIYHSQGVITGETEAEWCRANLKNLETVRLEGEVPGLIHFLQERFPAELGSALQRWMARL